MLDLWSHCTGHVLLSIKELDWLRQYCQQQARESCEVACCKSHICSKLRNAPQQNLRWPAEAGEIQAFAKVIRHKKY